MKHSNLQVKEFPKKFQSFLVQNDYDGNESIKINATDKEKIELITNLYKKLVLINSKKIKYQMNILPLIQLRLL